MPHVDILLLTAQAYPTGPCSRKHKV
jgi:hypothetical protein